MSYQNLKEFKQLRRSLYEHDNGTQVLKKFKAVVQRGMSGMTRDALCLVLQRIHMFSNQLEIRKYVCDIMPSNGKEDRLLLLCNVPLVMREMPALGKVVMKHIADTIMTSNKRKYDAARNRFGNFLIKIPASFLKSEKNESVEFPMSNAQRIEFLEFLEFTVSPTLNPKNMLLSNKMYLKMLATLTGKEYERVFKCLMESDNFSYFDHLIFFTKKYSQKKIGFDDVMMFAEKKYNDTTADKIFGYSQFGHQDRVEYSFLYHVLNPCNIVQMDTIMKKMNKRVMTSNYNAKYIAKEQLGRINKKRKRDLTLNERLKHLATWTIIAQCLPEERHAILDAALDMEELYDDMDRADRSMYFAVLASNSFPKEECKVLGSRSLFEKLISRLFEIVPPADSIVCTIEFNEYQSILYSLYNLFNMTMPLRHSLYQVEENWRPKLLNLIDQHIVTSDNLGFLSKIASGDERVLKIQQAFEMVTFTGTLLVFLFSVLNERKFIALPPYKNLTVSSLNCRFSDVLTSFEVIGLTKRQARPLSTIITFPHRQYLHEFDPYYRPEGWVGEEEEGTADAAVDTGLDEQSEEHLRRFLSTVTNMDHDPNLVALLSRNFQEVLDETNQTFDDFLVSQGISMRRDMAVEKIWDPVSDGNIDSDSEYDSDEVSTDSDTDSEDDDSSVDLDSSDDEDADDSDSDSSEDDVAEHSEESTDDD